MSDEQSFPDRPILMTPEKARDVARHYKGFAEQMALLGARAEQPD
jgi:hypothetical protein